jgi:(S)-mandelate dehydrogenase
MSLAHAINLDDLRGIARRRLPRIVADFVDGGADDEQCLARNRAAFARYALMPRYLRDVSVRNAGVTVLGRRYDAPIGISPMGHAGLVLPGVDLLLARAAARANLPYLLSGAGNATIEAVADIAPANTWFQVYTSADERINFDLLRRAQALAVDVLVVTVDVPVGANRERNRRNGFTRPPRLSAAAALEALLHPGWLLRFRRAGGVPPLANWQAYAPDASREAAAELFARLTPDPSMTWPRLRALRSRWQGRLVVKGILSPADALQAAQLGVDGLIVSNHGGRQLDAAPAPLDVLPFIRAAVGDRVELIFDSGVRRGSDIVKALALGACTTLFGRPWLHAAAAGGAEGVDHAIALLRRELDAVMAQAGLRTLQEAGPGTVWAPGDAGLAALAASAGAVDSSPGAAWLRQPGRPSATLFAGDPQ